MAALRNTLSCDDIHVVSYLCIKCILSHAESRYDYCFVLGSNYRDNAFVPLFIERQTSELGLLRWPAERVLGVAFVITPP